MKGLVGITAALVLLVLGAASALGDATGPQFRVSTQGTDGDANVDAFQPDVAHNPVTNQHLVVWVSEESDPEIYGQFIDADGNRVGAPFVISDDSEEESESDPPSVTYNEEDNEFLVSWDDSDSDRILIQRLSASGAELGMDTQISDDGVYSDIETTDLRYSAAGDVYLVIWKADGPAPEDQVFGQLINRDGSERNGDLTLSEMDDDANDSVGLTYNPADQEFFAVWRGRDTGSDHEIFGQRVNTDGSEDGPDMPVSLMGGGDSDGVEAAPPRVAYNSARNEYLVAWVGDLDVPTLVRGGGQGNDTDIIAQRLAADGSQIGADDFQISNMAPNGAVNRPDLVYNVAANEYFVAWAGEKVIDEGREVYGQYLTTEGTEIGTDDFRVSTQGPDGDEDFEGSRPTVAYNSRTCDYVTTWHGDTDGGGLVDNELEVWGRRISAPPCPVAAGPTPPAADSRAPRIAVAGVAARRCVSRDFRMRVRITEGTALRSARVSLDGRRIATTRRKRFSVVIRARRLRGGRHRIGIAATDAAGNRRHVVRRFRRCARQAVSPNLTG